MLLFSSVSFFLSHSLFLFLTYTLTVCMFSALVVVFCVCRCFVLVFVSRLLFFSCFDSNFCNFGCVVFRSNKLVLE